MCTSNLFWNAVQCSVFVCEIPLAFVDSGTPTFRHFQTQRSGLAVSIKSSYEELRTQAVSIEKHTKHFLIFFMSLSERVRRSILASCRSLNFVEHTVVVGFAYRAKY